jgi:predicted dehydrogenase
MTTRVRFGVLGCASIAVNKVIPAMQRSSRCEVVAIGSRDAERATATAAQLGIAHAHGSYDAVLADDEVDVVYIPLPNHLHAEWTARAVAAGKHVLCEKPLGLGVAEVEAMIAAADDAGVLLMEAFMYRFHPLWLRTRQLVDDGAIGELSAIQARFSYHNVDPANIRNVADYGGGAVMDIGCYPINVARWFFDGEPTAVAAAVRRDPEFGTDSLTSAVLDFERGQATFLCSTQVEPDQRVHLLGTAGRLEVEIPFNIPPHLPTRVVLTAGGDPPVAPDLTVYEVAAEDPYTAMADAFATAVAEGGPSPLPPADAIGNMAVIERILATPG